MRVPVFTEGTLLIDREWLGLPREEIVRRSRRGEGSGIRESIGGEARAA